jgi:tetratricopeptide (TPR) repeat protein
MQSRARKRTELLVKLMKKRIAGFGGGTYGIASSVQFLSNFQMIHRLRVLLLIALGLLVFQTGCERKDVLTMGSEESEPNYERGLQLEKQGRSQEALSAFLKVIADRREDAPESHLHAALIYERHIKDYIAAIHHFRKYIELQPNAKQADLVKGRIDNSRREFARSLSISPSEDSSVKFGYMEQLDRLQRENDQLKSEIAALRAALPSGVLPPSRGGGFDIPSTSSQTTPHAARIEGETDSDAPTRAPINHVDDAGQPGKRSGQVAASPSATPGKPSAPTRPGASMAGDKKHTVQSGDTLSILSLRYYGTRNRAKEIQAANREVLKGGDKLSIGMELRIP